MPATGRSPEMQFIPPATRCFGEGMTIRRALPSAQCRMIGAWCFLDHFGPVDATRGDGLRVGPHPHNSLQTFTWPLAGEILHRDSLGYEQIIRPGQVEPDDGRARHQPLRRVAARSLATAARRAVVIALPDAVRHCEPAFEHHTGVAGHRSRWFSRHRACRRSVWRACADARLFAAAGARYCVRRRCGDVVGGSRRV